MSGVRIRQVDDADTEKVTLDGKSAHNQISAAYLQASLALLLNKRNGQLLKFISHIATLCHHTESDDVTNGSISLDWKFDYLKRHYGLETKGANFMNINDHVFKQGTPYQTFYKQYRASFIDNLRKRGDIVEYKNNEVLNANEKLSPFFENTIVLWSLEKIDPCLPNKVKKVYGYQMAGNTTLR